MPQTPSTPAPSLSSPAQASLGEDGCWHIDVRGLPPPQPLVAILSQVDLHGHDGRPLIVHHDRDPALLYPELAERGWNAEIIDGERGEIRLRLQAA